MKDKKWINIKEYAQQQGITYEAGRQAVRRHRKKLQSEGHMIIQKNKTLLDEDAVAFLAGKHHKPKMTVRNSKDIWNSMTDAEKLENTQSRLDFARRDVETWTDKYMEIRKENTQLKEELESTKQLLQASMKKYDDMERKYYELLSNFGTIKNKIIDKIYDMDVLKEILTIIENQLDK